MSDKPPVAEFFFNLFINSLIASVFFMCASIFLLASSIGVNYFKDNNIVFKIFAFIFFGLGNIFVLIWYFLWKCKIRKKPLSPMNEAFPF